MKKLIIFDLDGTLIDSITDIGNSMNHVLKNNNLKEFTKDDLAEMVSDKVIIASSEFDKLKKYLENKKLSYSEIDNNTAEIESSDLRVHDFAKDMVEEEILIEAIYHKKVSLEDLFLTILTGGASND